jgi:mono/diheme cytochrome c family protein
MQCIACHADKDKHNGQNGTDCSICHTPKGWGDVNNP